MKFNYQCLSGWNIAKMTSGFFFIFLSLLLISCNNRDQIELTFAFGPEDSGEVASLIKDFNKAHKGKIRVNWQEGSRLSNEFYRQIANDFTSDKPSMDIIGSDVVWTSALAKAGWVEDVSSRFFANYENSDFIEASLNGATYQSKMWGIPWYTDAGILYYRKDLLDANGFDQPPATWEELRQMALTIMENEGTKYGFVFQGANYEGGVTNACEFIWNAGGNILISDLSAAAAIDESSADVSIITVNSEAAKKGLADAFQMIKSGVSPPEVSYFKEQDATTAFGVGDAIFMRNWPTAYPRVLNHGTVTTSQIAVAPLPVSEDGLESFSCLGGWNLMINKHLDADEKEAAWTFIQYMIAPEQQKRMALRGGSLPSLQALYDDEELLKEAPFIRLAKQVIQNTRVRPITPKYMEISPDMAWTFNEVLKGDLNPTEAVETMQGQMEGVFAAN